MKNIFLFYIENNVTYVFTSKGEKYTSNHNLRQLKEELDSKYFFQINRQTILSKESIKLVSPHMNRKLKIQTSIEFEKDLIVPKSKTSEFIKWMEF
jgi:DNA-binding LytR/AlgR family response regulator